MDRNDIERMASTVLRDYGVPMKVTGISPVGTGWTIAFAGPYPGAKGVQVNLSCERTSAHHVRESLKKGLDLTD